MDIAKNVEAYEGERVRTAGKIENVGTNVATRHTYFHFRSRETNYTNISFSLKGCPQEMQDMCSEGEYVVISGVVKAGFGSPSISDCFVECVGPEAENPAKQSAEIWKENYKAEREQFISSCGTHTYEELARYPDKYSDEHIWANGTVLQTDVIWGENVVLLDIGNGGLIYINYAGKQFSDPEILKNDKVSFYGKCAGTKTYVTVLGNNNTVPYVIALYSSINS